jgi:hypothetical protein
MSGALLVFPHRIGDCTIISVSYHANAARFRIAWRTDLGSQICKIAAYKVESDNCPWTELLKSQNYSTNTATVDSGLASKIWAGENGAIENTFKQPRRWQRHKVDVPIRVIVHGSNKTSLYNGRGNELSEGGMALTAGVELLLGDMVDIEFTPPYSGLPIRHKGTVRNRTGYRYGIEFLANNNQDAEQIERLLSMLTSM